MSKIERAKALTQKRIERRTREFAETTSDPEKIKIFERVMTQRDQIQEAQQKIATDRLLTAKVIVIDCKMIENFDQYVNWLGILLDKAAYHEEITFWVGVSDKEWNPEYRDYIQEIVDKNCLEKVTVMPYSLMEYLTHGFFSILCAFAQEYDSVEAIESVRKAKRSTIFLLSK